MWNRAGQPKGSWDPVQKTNSEIPAQIYVCTPGAPQRVNREEVTSFSLSDHLENDRFQSFFLLGRGGLGYTPLFDQMDENLFLNE